MGDSFAFKIQMGRFPSYIFVQGCSLKFMVGYPKYLGPCTHEHYLEGGQWM